MSNTCFNENSIQVFDADTHSRILGKAKRQKKLTLGGVVDVKETESSLTIDPYLLPTNINFIDQYADELLETKGVYNGISDLLSITLPSELTGLIDLLVEKAIPGAWTRVSFNGDLTFHPSIHFDEVGLVFDVETFVKGSTPAMPIVAQAISYKALWMWLHPSWDGNTPYTPMMASIGHTQRLIVGHNVSYDFARIKERYEFSPIVSAICTMAMVNSVHGLDGNSRMALHKPEGDRWRKLVESAGCAKSLVAAYNFVCGGDLTKADKSARNIFVDAEDFSEFIENRAELLTYSMLDVVYTLELFQELYPRFIGWAPDPSVLLGQIMVTDALLPIQPDHYEWIDRCDTLMDLNKYKILNMLFEYALDVEQNKIKFIDDNPELDKLDWRLFKPKNWRKKKLPEGWPDGISRWFKSFITGEFKLTGLDLPRMLCLRYNGSALEYHRGKGWCYKDRHGSLEKLPHINGKGDNVGNPLSTDSLRWVECEPPLLTSDLIPDDLLLDLMLALDGDTTWRGFNGRVKDKITTLL